MIFKYFPARAGVFLTLKDAPKEDGNFPRASGVFLFRRLGSAPLARKDLAAARSAPAGMPRPPAFAPAEGMARASPALQAKGGQAAAKPRISRIAWRGKIRADLRHNGEPDFPGHQAKAQQLAGKASGHDGFPQRQPEEPAAQGRGPLIHSL